MLYQDFDLLIDRNGDSLRAQVLNSPAGQASADFTLPFSEDKLEIYLLRLSRTHRVTRRVESQDMNTAKTFGAALFDAVFSGDVKACFRSSIDEVRRQNAGLRIRLRLGDPSVADLPWEFLYNRSVNRFIALSVHTPLVRYMDLQERIQPIAVKPPIRVLAMISSPSDFPQLDVEAEWTRLNESLADRIAAGQLAIERLPDASLECLQHKLRREKFHIFHFIGHGAFDEELQEGVLILESENKRGHKVDSQFLGMLLHDHESLRVAILNACEGARTSRTDPFAGSAQSLVQQGIPAVIAMQFEIADDVASRFAHEFYGALADGYPIDASLTEARKSIFAAGREVEWGTPVLYLRAPDGRIFDIEGSGAATVVPVRGGSKVVESAGRPAEDKFVAAIVAAAHSAFDGGQRVEALDMLRRYDPSMPGIGETLRELTAEHERLLAETHRAIREKLDEHLQSAEVLLAGGKVSEAWGHACDALQLDPTDKSAIALEAAVRKALDAQVARESAREQEEARRASAARALEAERASAGRHMEEPPQTSAPPWVLRPRFLSAAAAVIVLAGGAVWFVPRALTGAKQSPPAVVVTPATQVVPQSEPAPAPPVSSDPRPAEATASAPASPSAAPGTSEPAPAPLAPPAAPPDATVDPPAATTGTSSTPVTVPTETVAAGARKRAQTSLTKKAGSATGPATGPAAGRAGRGGDDAAVSEAEPVAKPVAEPEPPPVAPPPKRDSQAIPAKSSAPVDPVVQAYVTAIGRGDRAGLLAVYPAAPADLLATLGKRPAGTTLRLIHLFAISDARGLPEVIVTA